MKKLAVIQDSRRPIGILGRRLLLLWLCLAFGFPLVGSRAGVSNLTVQVPALVSSGALALQEVIANLLGAVGFLLSWCARWSPAFAAPFWGSFTSGRGSTFAFASVLAFAFVGLGLSSLLLPARVFPLAVFVAANTILLPLETDAIILVGWSSRGVFTTSKRFDNGLAVGIVEFPPHVILCRLPEESVRPVVRVLLLSVVMGKVNC